MAPKDLPFPVCPHGTAKAELITSAMVHSTFQPKVLIGPSQDHGKVLLDLSAAWLGGHGLGSG